MVEINKDQEILEDLLVELKDKLRSVTHIINCEMDKDDHRIFNNSLKNIDLEEYR